MPRKQLYAIYRVTMERNLLARGSHEEKKLVDVSIGSSREQALKNSSYSWSTARPSHSWYYRAEPLKIDGFKITLTSLEQKVSSIINRYELIML